MMDKITGMAEFKPKWWWVLIPRTFSCISHDVEGGDTRCEKWIVWMHKMWRHRVVWTMSGKRSD
jgi:hypothetical protein